MATKRIGFVLLSNSRDPLPSTRISVLNMFSYLQAKGFAPEIIFQPMRPELVPNIDHLDVRSLASRFDFVYFQKVCGPSVLRCARALELENVRTVYGHCDQVRTEMVEATSVTAVVTPYLRSLFPKHLQGKMHVVHDGIERPEIYRQGVSEGRGSRSLPLKAILVTSGAPIAASGLGTLPAWLQLTIVGAYPPARSLFDRLRGHYWSLNDLSVAGRIRYVEQLLRPRIRRVTWTLASVYSQLLEADIGIIPVESSGPDYWRLKSENRLTLKMAAGLPVVAGPVPAYIDVVETGRNAFIATSHDEWMSCLELLRDPDRRATVAKHARASVLEKFSMQAQADALAKALESAVHNLSIGPQKPNGQ